MLWNEKLLIDIDLPYYNGNVEAYHLFTEDLSQHQFIVNFYVVYEKGEPLERSSSQTFECTSTFDAIKKALDLALDFTMRQDAAL